MSNIESINPESNPIVSKLANAISEAVQGVIDQHPTNITYIELVGALEAIKADYILEYQAINLSE
jgi:hypothetical protein